MNKVLTETITPSLRFPEFINSASWEETTLEHKADYENGKAHENDISESGKYVVVNSKFISTDGTVMKRSNKGYCIAEKDDILMVLSDIPNGKAIAKCFYVLLDETYTVNQRICKLKPKNNTIGLYLYYYLNRNPYFLAFDDGVKQTNLKNEDVLKCPVLIPIDKIEQQKIASCLSSLDELISAENQKLEIYKGHKKGLMQQLFPGDGEKVPKVRFKEFENSGDWEEKQLNEISTSIFDGTHQTPKYTEVGIPFFSVENIISKNKNKFISSEDYLIATSKNKPEKGDILLTRIGNIGFSTIVDWDYEFSIYVTLAVVKKSEQFEPYYLHSFFQSDFYQKEIKSKSLLNAVPCKINMDELRKTKVLLPPDKQKKEQQKIASCLSYLDKLIVGQTEKIGLLKEHKKGLMQGMFPSVNEI